MTRATPSGLTIRPRREADFPALEILLVKQQAASEYPIIWPLPTPIRDFIKRKNERHAWVAEVDGEVLGHIAVMTVSDDGHGSEDFIHHWQNGHVEHGSTKTAPEVHQLFLIGVFFTDLDRSGSGIGHHLFQTAVEQAWKDGYPVLDVLSTHPGPRDFYIKRGWRVVGKERVPWDPKVPREALALVATRPKVEEA